MGILPSPKSQDKAISLSAKRRSVPTDFATLKPLKPGGALGFSTFRDTGDRSNSHGGAKKSSRDDSDMDSDEEDVGKGKSVKQEDADIQESGISAMSADDVRRQGELAEGVQKIRVYIIIFIFTLPLPFFLLGSHEDFWTETDHICVFLSVKTTTFSRSFERNVTSHASVTRLKYAHWRIHASSPLEFDRIPRYSCSHR